MNAYYVDFNIEITYWNGMIWFTEFLAAYFIVNLNYTKYAIWNDIESV